MSYVPFNDLDSTKKGTLGEKIVYNYLKNKGLIPYMPVFDGGHPFDIIVASPDKQSIVIAEVKTKPRLKYEFRIGDTLTYASGFDTSALDGYLGLKLKYMVPVHIYFVDELEGAIYGNSLSVLMKNSRVNGKQTIFRTCDMYLISKLTDSEVEEIKKYTHSKYDYIAVGLDNLRLKKLK